MSQNKQILIIFVLSIGFGLLRFMFVDDPEFTLIKKERIIQKISTFSIPEDMTEPMAINLEFAKFLFDKKTAIFIDARDEEDYNTGNIENSTNIPFDYYEDYIETIDKLDDGAVYVIYCSGDECSLSMDLADYLFNEHDFEKVLIFEGGWPQWRDAEYP